MPASNYVDLPWNFEAFRRYLTYDVLQQAAAALLAFEGERLFTDRALMNEFTEQLTKRTGLAWLPNRTASEGVLFNVEGSVFRNKARVFTSFYICDPKCILNGTELRMTDFGRALGLGYLSQSQFYREILARYEYPHPAYQDNWDAWSQAKIKLRPFVFILDILAEIYAADKLGELSTTELAAYAHPSPLHASTRGIATTILAARRRGAAPVRERTDKVDRKLGDIIGFLCITGAAYYKGNNIRLNLLAVQREEKTHFWEKRDTDDRLNELLDIINAAKKDIR